MQLDQAPLSPSFRRLLSSGESMHQVMQRERLAALNREIAEKFERQPTFHEFVQRELRQAFSELAQDSDPSKIFIRTSTPSGLSSTAPLLPNILEAVVRRIVEQQPADYASRQARFERCTTGGDATETVSEITAAQFDRFLDQLANGLVNRYASYLQGFWATAVSLTDTRSRKQWLIDQRAGHLRLEAELLKADGLLSDGGYALLTKVLRYRDAPARRKNLLGYCPCVYSVALAGEGAAPHLALHGALVMTARDPDHAVVWEDAQAPEPSVRSLKSDADVGSVVLFTPTQGLECFASLALLDQELHRRLRVSSEFSGLLMLIAQNDQTRATGRHLAAKTEGGFLYGELNGSAFAESVEAQCTCLHRDFSAQVELYRNRGVSSRMGDLPASLDRVTDLRQAFGLDSVLLARELKRVAKALSDFLEPALQVDREAWGRAVERYRTALSELPEWAALPSLLQFGDTATLQAYSNEQLRMALDAEYGLDVNPDHILVHTSQLRKPVGSYVPGASPLVPEGQRYLTRKRTLTQLALENVGGIDLNFVNFSRLTDLQDRAYSALTTAQVKDLVRTVNIGGRYPDFLKHRLLTSPEALLQKTSYARIAALQMRVDALEAKIAGDFLPDRLDRGFQWVNSVLNHPQDTSDRAEVEGHRVLVRGLMIRGVRVRGVMVFSTASESVGSLVAYMPQAPSGRVFYEFADSAELARQLIDHSSWHEYLVNRVSLEDQAVIRRTLRGGVRGEMVHLPRISENVLMEAYELEASAAINMAAHRTTSTHETNIDTTFTLIEASLDVITLVLPVKVTMVIGMARSIFSIVRAIQAAEAGDRERAAHNFVRAFAELVGAAVDGFVGSASVSAGAVSKKTGLSSNMALSKKPSGLTPLPGWELHGIFSQPPGEGGFARHFLRDKEHWYSIKYDPDAEVWRVRDARKPFAYHHAPLRRDASGHWEVASPRIGLKGGYPAEQTLMNAFPYLTRTGARRILDAFSFPPGRVLELELELAREMSLWSDIPGRFHPYLNQPLDHVRLRMSGYEPIDPSAAVAGPSRVPVLPPVRLALQPGFQPVWTEWGKTIPASQIAPNPSRAYTFTVSDPSAGLRGDVIAIGQHYYSVLPKGENCPDTLAHLYDPSQPPLNVASFNDPLTFDFKRQPRIAHYDQVTGRWQVDENPMLWGEANRLLVGAFHAIAHRARRKLTEAVFNHFNPGGEVTSGGLTAFLGALNTWRSVLNSGMDPLQFLSASPRNAAGKIRLDVNSTEFLQINFGISEFKRLGLTVTASMDAAAIRGVMRKLVTSIGYQLIGNGGPGPELLFRWSPTGAVYCLSLQPVLRQSAKTLHPLGPGLDLTVLDAATHAVVSQSQARGDFVMLHSGIILRRSYPAVFILKQ
jgi:hypothetical protein